MIYAYLLFQPNRMHKNANTKKKPIYIGMSLPEIFKGPVWFQERMNHKISIYGIVISSIENIAPR